MSDYYEKPFPSAALDRWLTTEPEYDDDPECGDLVECVQCSGCGETKDDVDVACGLCSTCHQEVDEAEARFDAGLDSDE